MRSAEWWNLRYLSGDAPWDTGIVPPEVVALVGSGALSPGWALDLGCGSGISTLYLAHSALAHASRAAAAEHLPAYFCLGDVSDLSFLSVRVTFALDVGCLHGLPLERRAGYMRSLAEHLLPGAFYLLYAFSPSAEGGSAGLGPHDLAGFAPHLELCWSQHGYDRARPSAWYLLQRSRMHCPPG